MGMNQILRQNLSLQLSTSQALQHGLDELHLMIRNNEDRLAEPYFLKDMKMWMLRANKREFFSGKLPAQHFLRSDKGLLERVLEYASKRHRGEYRESGYPYLAHVYATGFLLARLGFPKEIVLSGLVHDAIEDNPDKTGVLNEIYALMPAMAYYVYSVSGPDIRDSVEKDKVLNARIHAFSEHANNSFPQAIKCADGIANLYDLDAMQAKDGRTATQRKRLFLDKLRDKVLPYAAIIDQENYIPIRKRKEVFSLHEYLVDVIEEKTQSLMSDTSV